MTSSRAAAFAFALLYFSVGTAQIQRGNGDTLSTDDIIIVRDFEPVISTAIKITEEPEPLKIEPEKIEFDYDFLPLSYQSDYLPDTIKAARIKGEPLSRLYKNYLEAGMGNYLATHGKLRINNTRSRNGLWGLALDHRAAGAGINDVPFSGFSRNRAEIHGKRFLKAHVIKGKVGFDRRGLHYYGYNQAYFDSVDYSPDDIEKDNIKRIYNLLSARASLKSFYADSSALNYDIDLDYNYLFSSGLSAVDEHHIVANSRFEKYSGGVLGILDLNIDYNDNTTEVPAGDSSTFTENLLITLGPGFEAKGDSWRAFFGMKAVVENENDEAEFRFYPNVHLSYNVYENYIIPYAGITGGMERVNFNALRTRNRFVNPVNTLRNQNTRYDFYGGIRGAFSSQISFNAKASVREVANQAFFTYQNTGIFSDPSAIAANNATFNVAYDTLAITQLTGEVTYFHDEKINMTARFDYYGLEPFNLPRAWHMPEFTATLSGRYNLRDKIIGTADVFYVSVREAPTLNPEETPVSASEFSRELKPYIDINLGIEYRYTKKLGAFIRAHNIAAMRYETWQNHPVQRFNFIAGVSYSFLGD